MDFVADKFKSRTVHGRIDNAIAIWLFDSTEDEGYGPGE